MSNFGFLKAEWPELCQSAARAESNGVVDPRAACFYARRSLELAVNWLFAREPRLDAAYDDALNARLHEAYDAGVFSQAVFAKARLVKDLGNRAVHSAADITAADATQCLKELFHTLYWLAHTYTQHGTAPLDGLVFDVTLLSLGAKQAIAQKKTSAAQMLALQSQLELNDKKLREQTEELLRATKTADELDAEIKLLKAEVAAVRKRNEAVPDTHDYSEAETRDYFIDLLLREAGWPLNRKEDREFPVTGMPNNSGNGFVDYVLWNDDGLPLAVVEAKRTRKDARIGQQQAKCYADCLEARYGQRPVIFYTNGYETWIWDDLRYPPRAVQGFYKKDELQLLIQRRTTSKPLGAAPIDSAIVERPYQHLAIKGITAAFDRKRRKALVVMATGAGKTRAVIALADVLQKCNQAKRVLFLADRRALVKQAANAFKSHLSGSSPVNLLEEKEDVGSRVLFATYPTMMNLINRMQGDARRFSAGHFDLIVIDEAHRSVYQKYGAIFAYFDSLLVGLTATPRSEVDKNTYRLFDLESGVPTYAYELEDAVKDGWLVPMKAISVPLKFQRDGIKYDDLSDEEKAEWDELEWDEEGKIPDEVNASELNSWLFNEDTVDKVLAHLMTNGLKVEDGDRLGKTIIFAKNHKHAIFIQERFDKNYPHLAGHFARVIDNYEPYAESLLDAFSQPNKMPHIAISVDMLDTGIDIPEIVNLVFFKMVRSKTKFWQMIGRGTRLRPDLFGPKRDKEFFYLFDYCQNLEFFGANAKGVEAAAQEPLGKKLFLRRLELMQEVRKIDGAGDAEPPVQIAEARAAYPRLDAELADLLHTEVAAMNENNFIVRPKRRYLEPYRERAAWEEIKPEQAAEIGEHLAGLPAEIDPEDITARQFDLLMLNLQLAYLRAEPGLIRLQSKVTEIAERLEEKRGVPLVFAQMELIQEIQTGEFWQNVTLSQLETVRKRLRDLVKFMDKDKRNIVYTDFQDEIGAGTEFVMSEIASGIDVAQYRKKVLHFLKAHENDPVIGKLKQNEPLTPTDLTELETLLYELGGDGSAEKFKRAYDGPQELRAFVRKLVGLDRAAAQKAFARFLDGATYNEKQIRFAQQIVDYLTQNGVMEPGKLYEQPFTAHSPLGLDGLFPEPEADAIMQILALINKNAGLAGPSASANWA